MASLCSLLPDKRKKTVRPLFLIINIQRTTSYRKECSFSLHPQAQRSSISKKAVFIRFCWKKYVIGYPVSIVITNGTCFSRLKLTWRQWKLASYVIRWPKWATLVYNRRFLEQTAIKKVSISSSQYWKIKRFSRMVKPKLQHFVRWHLMANCVYHGEDIK